MALTMASWIGVTFSPETIQRELHATGYVWRRAKLKARDDDPEHAHRLARIRVIIEQLRPFETFFWVDELDIHHHRGQLQNPQSQDRRSVARTTSETRRNCVHLCNDLSIL